MRNILIVTAFLLNTPALLSAQTLASAGNVQQAKMELSTTVQLLEQNTLLALTAGVLLLGLLFGYYVFREYTQSDRNRQAKHNHLM